MQNYDIVRVPALGLDTLTLTSEVSPPTPTPVEADLVLPKGEALFRGEEAGHLSYYCDVTDEMANYDYVYVPTSTTVPHITTPTPYVSTAKAVPALPPYPRLKLVALPVHTH